MIFDDAGFDMAEPVEEGVDGEKGVSTDVSRGRGT